MKKPEKWEVKGFRVIDERGDTVCEFGENADGVLIAAAPQMFEALKRLTQVSNTLSHDRMLANAVIGQALEVINKVKGQTNV